MIHYRYDSGITYRDVKKYYELDICLKPCEELSWQIGGTVMGVGVVVEAEIILKIGFLTFLSFKTMHETFVLHSS